ncbi:cytochrome ubiquinol oxidase subunit I [Streptomyces phaeochromogenes]|nr:cytochrome ubiquinol oxidase subunit I [Streptomyces phaeochromogenes]
MIRFWRRIFAVGFAIGVAAGTVITFQMGLNWGVYGAKTGPITGPIIGMEVVTAFFVEAGFIGVLLYKDGRVRKGTMFLSSVMVSVGTVLLSTASSSPRTGCVSSSTRRSSGAGRTCWPPC